MDLNTDDIVALIAITALVITWYFCTKKLRQYLLKWLAASLIMPLLVALFQSTFGGLIHIFWPGSIVLMSLGSSPKPLQTVIYTWSYGIGLNLVLYFVLGLIIYFIRTILQPDDANTKKT